MSFISSIPSSGDNSSLICHIASSGDGVRHCGGDIGCVGFSWNDRGGGGGGGWRKNYLIIHCHWSWG